MMLQNIQGNGKFYILAKIWVLLKLLVNGNVLGGESGSTMYITGKENLVFLNSFNELVKHYVNPKYEDIGRNPSSSKATGDIVSYNNNSQDGSKDIQL